MTKAIIALHEIHEALDLIKDCGLPISDILVNDPPLFFGIREGQQLIAVIGLEIFETIGLLRSLAVAPHFRGYHLAHQLVSFIEFEACSRSIKSLFILTQSADKFFLKLGYEKMDRSHAPHIIQAHALFSKLCPFESVFLRKKLS